MFYCLSVIRRVFFFLGFLMKPVGSIYWSLLLQIPSNYIQGNLTLSRQITAKVPSTLYQSSNFYYFDVWLFFFFKRGKHLLFFLFEAIKDHSWGIIFFPITSGSPCLSWVFGVSNATLFLCVAAVTIISGIIMLILFVSELQYYLTKEVSSATAPLWLFSSPPRKMKFDMQWNSFFQ